MRASARIVPASLTLTDALPEPLVTLVVIMSRVGAGLVAGFVCRGCERRDGNNESRQRRGNYLPSELAGRVVIPLNASTDSRSMRR